MSSPTELKDLPEFHAFFFNEDTHGWVPYGVTWTSESGEVFNITHILPCGDTRLHRLCHSCWCSPTPDDEYPFMTTHHSADGRERYEEGLAKPN